MTTIKIEELERRFKALKEKHELPNDNPVDYNRGYVAAMNHAINNTSLLSRKYDEAVDMIDQLRKRIEEMKSLIES